jgi:Skp family chaperone for outer membrane proteins
MSAVPLSFSVPHLLTKELTMTRGIVLSLAAGLVAMTTLSADAQDGKKGKKNADAGAATQAFQLPKEITLSTEQQAKMDALKKEYGPKLTELQKKADDLLTPEQKQARKDAFAKVRADKLEGKARREALESALNLTPEQKTKYDAAQKDLQAKTTEVKGKIADFLTAEQKEKAPNLVPKGKKKAA